jgi:hypothetical protein
MPLCWCPSARSSDRPPQLGQAGSSRPDTHTQTFNTWDGICKQYNWPRTFVGHSV